MVATPPAARQGIFLKAAEVLEARQDEVVSMLARETGCTFGFGMFQMHFVPGLFRQAAALAYAPLGEVLPSDTGAFAMGVRRPVGVVGAIAPWNAALILSARAIAAPLALGNTVVLKPSEWSPQVGGLLWGEVFAEAGLPEGVLNVVTHAPGEAQPIGDELVENPSVRRLNFTGSTATGRKLAEAAGRQLEAPLVLELGGYNPLIVLADADLEYAVNATTFGAFLHQGQICMSARRIIVERPVAEEFVARLAEKTRGLKVGDPKEPDTIIGPVMNGDALETIKARGRRGGAEWREGARRRRRRGGLFSADAPHRRAGGLGVRQQRDVRSGRRDRGRRYRRGGGRPRERNQLRALLRDHHADADRGLALAQQVDAGIVHVTTSRSGTSPRCRSAASRTAVRQLRRLGSGGRVHRDALDHGAARLPARSRSEAPGGCDPTRA